VFWPLQSSFEFSGVPKDLGVSKDSQVPISGVLMSSSRSFKVGLQHSPSIYYSLQENTIFSIIKKKKKPLCPLVQLDQNVLLDNQFVPIYFDCHVFLTMRSWDVLSSQND
jgi:hypothetical protein